MNHSDQSSTYYFVSGQTRRWASLQLIYEQHKDSDTRIVKAPDEVIEALETGQLELQTVSHSTSTGFSVSITVALCI